MTAGLEGIGQDNGRGYNQYTISGTPFFPADPRPEEIHLEDIAHALAMQCRFNGHTREFYSVAQHSCLFAEILIETDQDMAREALMHDAAEAYIGDLVRPVKAACPDWQKIDEHLDVVIRARFGLLPYMPDLIREMDLRMAVTERRDVLKPAPAIDWGVVPEPFDFKIIPVSPLEAKSQFLRLARKLEID